jgi:hypothetical protein
MVQQWDPREGRYRWVQHQHLPLAVKERPLPFCTFGAPSVTPEPLRMPPPLEPVEDWVSLRNRLPKTLATPSLNRLPPSSYRMHNDELYSPMRKQRDKPWQSVSAHRTGSGGASESPSFGQGHSCCFRGDCRRCETLQHELQTFEKRESTRSAREEFQRQANLGTLYPQSPI